MISKMQFLGGFDPGTYPSVAHVRRSVTFGHVILTQNEMESYGPALVVLAKGGESSSCTDESSMRHWILHSCLFLSVQTRGVGEKGTLNDFTALG